MSGTRGILAFDPGGTTGWAYTEFPETWFAEGGGETIAALDFYEFGQVEGPEVEQADEIAELVDSHEFAWLVSERFTVRQFNQSREFLAPVRLNACLEWFCSSVERRLYWQDPSAAMNRWTDARMGALYKEVRSKRNKGGPHAADAMRHALLFAVRVASGSIPGLPGPRS